MKTFLLLKMQSMVCKKKEGIFTLRLGEAPTILLSVFSFLLTFLLTFLVLPVSWDITFSVFLFPEGGM